MGVPDERKHSVTDICEVRRLVEVPMAELAARRATPEQRGTVAEAVVPFDPDIELGVSRDADHRFHAALAGACGNPALAELYEKVLETLFLSSDFDSLLSASGNESPVRRVIREGSTSYREIAAAIVVGDVAAVRTAVEGHLNQVETLMDAQMT